MIVKMKKICLVVLDSVRESALLKLRDLGVVHIETERERTTDAVHSLIEKKTLFERGAFALSLVKGKTEHVETGKYSFHEAEKLAGRISSIQDQLKQLEDEKEKIRKDILSLTPWGDFSTSAVSELEHKGLVLKFYELSNAQLASLPDDIEYIQVKRIKSTNFIIVVDTDGTSSERIPAEPFSLPKEGISQLLSDIEKNEAQTATLENELESLSAKKTLLTQGLQELECMLEFESVNASMQVNERFAYISGYIPVDKIEAIKKEAASMHWALLIRNPMDHETPPTLVTNPKWISVIQPLFKFLDTTPGYREFDVSMLFLIFLTVFTAMIIGDAGYGIVFLSLTLFIKMKLKHVPSQLIVLLSVLSLSTIAWGVITGTWFGSTSLAEIPVLKSLIIPQIASFGPQDSAEMIQQLCFLIGMTHLTIGILISFARKMPALAAFAELGWLLILFSMYFFARFFVLGVELNRFAVPCFAAGFGLILLFSEQNGKNILKGILRGIAWSPMKFLNSVSMFADLVSYIRLFAVGLATVAVAQSFNSMVSGFDEIPGMIIAAIILFIAHTFNMAMALLAVIVHGVRLNMLEFGGKIGMEWSGYAYNPFRKKSL